MSDRLLWQIDYLKNFTKSRLETCKDFVNIFTLDYNVHFLVLRNQSTSLLVVILHCCLLWRLLTTSTSWKDLGRLDVRFHWCLPNSHGFTTILVMVDRLSKTTDFGALLMHYTINWVIKLCYLMVVRLRSLPHELVFYQGFFSPAASRLNYLSPLVHNSFRLSPPID